MSPRVIYGSAEGRDVRLRRTSLTIYIYARVRAHTRTRHRRLIVSVVACNPRGHRKHVINTCSLSARALAHTRERVAVATRLSRAERRLLPSRFRVIARASSTCARVYIYHLLSTLRYPAPSPPHVLQSTARLVSLSLAWRHPCPFAVEQLYGVNYSRREVERSGEIAIDPPTFLGHGSIDTCRSPILIHVG